MSDFSSQRSEVLASFPLAVLLFPGEELPLHIFEPRYRQLISEVRKKGSTFAVPYVMSQAIQKYGCEVRLKEVVAENPGGRMVIVVEGVSLVQIQNHSDIMEGKLYGGATILRFPCSTPLQSEALIQLIHEYRQNYDHDFLSCCEDSITRQDVVSALNLSSEDKYKFICMKDDLQKETYLINQLRYLKKVREQELLLGDDFGLN